MVDKIAKWGALFAIISSVLVIAFQEFTPKYSEWKKNYPSYDDESDENTGSGLVDPLRDAQRQEYVQTPVNPLM